MLRDGLSAEAQTELDRVLEDAEAEPSEHAMTPEQVHERMLAWGGDVDLAEVN